MVTKYILQGGFGGTPSADSRLISLSCRTRNLHAIRPDNMYQPLAGSLKRKNMRLLILLILIQFHLGLCSQNLENSHSDSKTSLTQTEIEQLKVICNKECQTYDFTNKNIAFAGGTSGNVIFSKEEFFKNMKLNIEKEKKNVCSLIALTESEKQESGGFDVIIMTPVKIFTESHRQKLIRELNKTAR